MGNCRRECRGWDEGCVAGGLSCAVARRGDLSDVNSVIGFAAVMAAEVG